MKIESYQCHQFLDWHNLRVKELGQYMRLAPFARHLKVTMLLHFHLEDEYVMSQC